MRNHTCLLDHHQRSHYDTITIGPKGKFNWVLKVDQQPESKVVRRSRGDVQHATFSQLTQSISEPICDRSGQPEDMQDVFVVKGETSRSHEINEKGFHEKLCASDRSGQPEITPGVIEARNLSENTRVEQTHDGSGQPDERNSSSAHRVKEQHAHEVHREIALFNTDDFLSCNQRGGHRLQHSRTTTFYRETIAWRQRSRIDSENREPTRIDTLFNETYNKVSHLIPSAMNQKK